MSCCSGRSSKDKGGGREEEDRPEEDPATPSACRKFKKIESSCGPELFVPPIYSLALYRQSSTWRSKPRVCCNLKSRGHLGTGHHLSGSSHQDSTPLALSPPGCPTPVITRNPAFACPTPSLEWDCDPATTRLGEGVKNIPEGETPGISFSSGGFLLLEQPEEEEVTLEERVGVVEGIKALERTQIPIVSTEESIEIESPEKSEKPVNMTQREMVDMEGNIVGQIGLTKGLMAINPVTSFTSVTQMDNMNARLGEEYAKLAGRLEEWRRKYRALVDNDNYEEIKGMLDDLFNQILAYGVELRTKSQEMEANAPQPQLQPQANPRHNEVDHLQRKADMLSLAELVKDDTS